MAETVSTAVITGRRINGSERFNRSPLSLLCLRGRNRLRTSCGGSAAGIHTHLAVWSYGHLAGNDDILSRGYTLANHDVIALPLAQGHKPQVRRVVGFHHVDEWTFLADLSGLA